MWYLLNQLSYMALPCLGAAVTILLGCQPKPLLITQKIVVPAMRKKNSDHAHTAVLTHYNPPPITIWIHGTRFIPRIFSDDPLHGIPGLKCALNLSHRSSAYKTARILSAIDPMHFNSSYFYYFYWSGSITNQARQLSAHVLYEQLQALVHKYITKYKTYPIIRIIAHSHGGNVALNMVMAQQALQAPSWQPLDIDTLICLACPVQCNTMHLTQHTMFKNIYSLYSSLDMVQIIAPQRFHGFLPFSYRRFPVHQNIVQAKIRFNGHAVTHAEFISKRFIHSLPSILNSLHNIAQSSASQWQTRDVLLRIIARHKNRKRSARRLTTSSSKHQSCNST